MVLLPVNHDELPPLTVHPGVVVSILILCHDPHELHLPALFLHLTLTSDCPLALIFRSCLAELFPKVPLADADPSLTCTSVLMIPL